MTALKTTDRPVPEAAAQPIRSSVDQDMMQLYSQRILALAASIPHQGALEVADGEAMKRSPLCGSTVTVGVRLDGDGRVADFAQNVKACALGQASAAVLGETAIGRSRDEIATGRDALKAMLKDGAEPPAAPFDGLSALLPARDYKNRHASILLAWDATLAAIDKASS